MTLNTILQTLIFGVFVGSIYGIVAVGLGLVFGVMGILNVAHGDLLMVGGYVGFWLVTLTGIDPFLSLIIVGPLMFLMGIALNRLLYRRIIRFEGETKLKNSLLISFGLVLILQQVATLLWTGDERTIQTANAGKSLMLGGLVFPYTRLANLGIGLLIIVLLHLFLHRTYFGKALRATAEDWEAAILAGIDIQRVYMVAFSLGTALAGIAGTLVAVNYGLGPTIGLSWTLKALIVVVLAGTGSVTGAFPAGILLGVIEAISALAIDPAYREVVGLVLFMLILLLRPQGLFGKAERGLA
ncbi:MAG: branched-chain amino acid ABC transporter permease [Chloroflexota bacterium]